MITILDTVDGIYYIGGALHLGHYSAGVEHLLRISHAGRKFSRVGVKAVPGSNMPVIKPALWPKILERAHSKSSNIYDNCIRHNDEAKSKKKCATGLFHLVRHFCGPLLAENHRCRSCDNHRETSVSVSATASATTAATTANRVFVRNNVLLNRKRKHS